MAYGDESQVNNLLIYAFAIIGKNYLSNLEFRLAELKKFYRIPASTILHCKDIFSGDNRKKVGLAHLGEKDVFDLVKGVVAIINRIPIFIKYAYCDHEKCKNVYTFPSSDTNLDCELLITPTPQGLHGLLAQACFIDRSHGPLFEECEVTVSHNATKAKFIGKKRRQAHNWCSGFYDTGSAVKPFSPHIVKADGSSMLQIADVASYICSHALSLNSKTDFSIAQLECIQFKTAAVLLPEHANVIKK
ncbi:MAG: hypothetical protein V4496_06095 [Pseudomonadota bacterium]